MPFLGLKISKELETLIDEEVKRSDKSKSDIVRDALNQYFNVAIPGGTGLIVLDKNELIKLIDSRLGVKPEVKREGKTVELEVKPGVKREAKTVKPDVKLDVKLDVKPAPPEDPVTTARKFILAKLEAGREPTAAEVAEAVGMDPKRLGTLLGKAGIKARSVHRGGKKARRYTSDMIEEIREMLAAGELSEEEGAG
jgi:hypothetical protein